MPAPLRLHLVSDLDGTWLPPGEDRVGLRALQDFVASEPGIVVTYATGRTLASALSAIDEHAIALPRHLITDVGTAIHLRDEERGWMEDSAFAALVASRWDAASAERLADRSLPPNVRRQAGVSALRRLPLEISPGADLREASDGLRACLRGAGIVADVLPSSGWCLDVLPSCVHKGTAMEHLRRTRELPKKLMVCGDSENDLGMLRLADIAVLMPSSHLRPADVGPVRGRVVVPNASGPRGILEVLLDMAEVAETEHFTDA